jgi:uncharacterized membrane protein
MIFSSLDLLQERFPGIRSYPEISNALTVIMLILFGPLYLGLHGYLLKTMRGESSSLKDLFDGFRYSWESSLLALLMGILTFLWCLLLIIPGLVKAASYSMSFFIMYDNPGIKPREALRRSQIMMKGYKKKYAMLLLSLAGWAALGVVTLGIGFFWISPYIYLSLAHFYENLKQLAPGASSGQPA